MMEAAVIAEPAKASRRKAIIRQAMSEYGLTEEEFFGRGTGRDLVEARSKAAHGLRALGLSSNRIGAILKRDHSSILNYFNKGKEKRGNRYTQRRIFRHLPTDLCDAISEIAKAEDTTIETLIAQWVGERAAYELAAKARAA